MRVNNWPLFIQSIPFPSHCILCNCPLGVARDFCPECQGELPYNKRACPHCALPVSATEDLTCGRCLRQPPPFDTCRAPLLYRPPFNRLIGGFKYQHKLHLAGPLSRLFLERLPPDLVRPDLILPMPLHPHRLRERGFNQSLELARGVARTLGLKLDWRSCRRVRATPPQSGLDEATRRKNLRGAFVARGELAGRHIALFDDVITTGATVTAVTRALHKAGAARVDVWALARTPNPGMHSV